MVMASSDVPSPQCVGREFVRQYYTLLHEAPLHLHRFYSHNSLFLHGGIDEPGKEEEPVMGQQEIHKKIMQLNFRDCHAKIRQVDSHATLGNGVVVQVTGELSNNGQPMRRFMQTFVLAPQSPKKYYVHNDIFRYQDEVFNDNESEAEDAVIQEHEMESHQEIDVQDPTVTSFYQQEEPPTTNGTGGDLEEAEGEVPAEEPMSIVAEEVVQDEPKQEAKLSEHESETPAEELVEDGPNTYAKMASKSAAAALGSQGAPPATKQQPDVVQDTTAFSQPHPQRAPAMRGRGGRGAARGGMGAGAATAPRTQGPDGDGSQERRTNYGIGVAGGGGGGVARYPDSQQLFVGNLLQDIKEDELTQHFEYFGKVLEVKINQKTGMVRPGVAQRNFGFVIFDDETSVQKAMEKPPRPFRGTHRLNIEEKKPKLARGAPDMRGAAGDSRPNSGIRPPTRGGATGRGGPRIGGRGGLQPPDSRGGNARGAYRGR